MAVFKANYVRRGNGEKKRAKATIRYIENRRGKDGERVQRSLFTSDGKTNRQEAYWMIDEAEKGSYYYRFIISADPVGEDGNKDLDMRDMTQRTMQELDTRFGRPVQWVAVIHADHKPHRHVHLLAVTPGKLQVKDLEKLRGAATEACLEQRRDLDLQLQRQERERRRQQEQEAQWQLTL